MRKIIYAFILIASLAVLSSSSSSYVTTTDCYRYYMHCSVWQCDKMWMEGCRESPPNICLYCSSGSIHVEDSWPCQCDVTLYTYYWWCPVCWNQWSDYCVEEMYLSHNCPYCFDWLIQCTYWEICD